MKEEQKLTTEQAANHLGLSASTLRLDRKKRHLGIPFFKKTVGRGNVHYLLADLDAWSSAITHKSRKNLEQKS